MKNPTGKDCVRCHLEHNGLDFSLLHWEPSQKQFDHKLTGYALKANTRASLAHSATHRKIFKVATAH